jgi:hypothetical protein
MIGKKILEELRLLIDDQGYTRFNEINQSYRKLCKLTKFTWLRVSDENLLSFQADTTSYDLDMSRMRVLTGLFVKGGNDARYRLLEEVPPELFEVEVRRNQDTNGVDTTSKPLYYKIMGGQVPRIEITPTPDQAYTVRVDYIRTTETITIDGNVNLPENYFDSVAKYAASLVLRRVSDPERKNLGAIYEAEAFSEFSDLVRDTFNNRTFDLGIKPRSWMR